MSHPLRVAVGVVLDDQSRVLVARRGEHQHQGNKWEFPGGKIEPDESLAEALKREFHEEVNLQLDVPDALKPWMVIEHDYGDKQVRLEIALIHRYFGNAQGLEGQAVRWQSLSTLSADDFPAANASIINALTEQAG